jgi:hypothetical protein
VKEPATTVARSLEVDARGHVTVRAILGLSQATSAACQRRTRCSASAGHDRRAGPQGEHERSCDGACKTGLVARDERAAMDGYTATRNMTSCGYTHSGRFIFLRNDL